MGCRLDKKKLQFSIQVVTELLNAKKLHENKFLVYVHVYYQVDPTS